MQSRSSLVPWLLAGAILAVLALVRLWALSPLGLVHDEAYYWLWAQYPSLGYFDHSAGVASWGWLGQQILGYDFNALRSLNGLFLILMGLASAALVSTLMPAPRRGAVIWAAALAGLSASQLGYVVWTADGAFILFLTLATWQLARVLKDESQGAWLWSGLFFGLALYAKETALLFALVACALILISPQLRTQLRTPWPWMGLSLMMLGGLPTLIWNVQHDWILLTFQANHAFADNEASGIQVDSLYSLTASYVFGLGPLLVFSLTKIRTSPGQVVFWPLWALALIPTLIFFAIAAYKPLQPNWAAPSLHLLLLLILPQLLSAATPWRWATLLYFGLLSLAALALLLSPSRLTANSNSSSMVVWEPLYDELEALRQQSENNLGQPVLLLGNRYQEASQLNYWRAQRNGFGTLEDLRSGHLPALNFKNRSNHYDYILADKHLGGRAAWVVRVNQAVPSGLFAEVLDQRTLNIQGITHIATLGILIENPRPQMHPKASP